MMNDGGGDAEDGDDEADLEAVLRARFDGADLLGRIERLEREEALIRQKWAGDIDLGNFQIGRDADRDADAFSMKTTFAKPTTTTMAPTETASHNSLNPSLTLPSTSFVPIRFSTKSRDGVMERASECIHWGPTTVIPHTKEDWSGHDDASRHPADSAPVSVVPQSTVAPATLLFSHHPPPPPVVAPKPFLPSVSAPAPLTLHLPETQIRNIFACRRLNAIDAITEELIDEALGDVAEELKQFANTLADALVDSELKNRWEKERKNRVEFVDSEGNVDSISEAVSGIPSSNAPLSQGFSNQDSIQQSAEPQPQALQVQPLDDNLKEIVFSQLDSISQRRGDERRQVEAVGDAAVEVSQVEAGSLSEVRSVSLAKDMDKESEEKTDVEEHDYEEHDYKKHDDQEHDDEEQDDKENGYEGKRFSSDQEEASSFVSLSTSESKGVLDGDQGLVRDSVSMGEGQKRDEKTKKSLQKEELQKQEEEDVGKEEENKAKPIPPIHVQQARDREVRDRMEELLAEDETDVASESLKTDFRSEDDDDDDDVGEGVRSDSEREAMGLIRTLSSFEDDSILMD